MKCALDRLYSRYNYRELVPPDPLQFVYHYIRPADMEIAALLASALAYGRVQQIEKSLARLFERMGDSPFEFVVGFDRSKKRMLKDFKHRFTSGQDISDLLASIKTVLGRYGSIEKFFVSGYNPGDRNIIPALSRFCDRLLSIHTAGHKGPVPRGLRFLLAGPSGGSACKRLNLFLRWMIRCDNVDTGLWKSIEPVRLIVPVDVHIGRLCKILGFYNRKTVSLTTAVEITERFAEMEPADPVKYDFALSRIGIVENCNGGPRPACERCELGQFCHHRIVDIKSFVTTG
ncbi:MAG: TIGR02757 family protein [Planctomycetes bacterium RBG_16_55_9]|nr:MAG: TIGR02757 family protein [Planctomycetes bacterium RBG_16_55_9]